MRADVVDGEDLALTLGNTYGDAVELDRDSGVVREVGDGAHAQVVGHGLHRPAASKLVVDGGHQPLLDLGKADAGDEVGEEPAYDEAARGAFVDAAGHQIEQLLVVEAPGRGGVAGTGHLAGLDLEVRHAVG